LARCCKTDVNKAADHQGSSTQVRNMPHRLPLRSILAPLLLGASLGAAAQSGPAGPLWELGAAGFGVSQQAYPGSDQRVTRGLVLPYAVYRGEFLRADRDGAGLRALRTTAYELDIGVAGSFGSSSETIDARRGMADLGTLIEFGPRLRLNLGRAFDGRWRLDLPLRAVFDLSDGFAHRGTAFEPELSFQRRSPLGFAYGASVGAAFGEQRLAGIFYTVLPAQATATRAAYDARSGLIAWRASASLARDLSPDWRVFGVARWDSVAGAANEDSPLVRRTSGTSVGVGLAWTWKRSQQRAAD